jgi:competence protein ComEC
MSVGFQLSYLAVAGIVYLHPRIYSLLEPRYWLVDKIWELSSVSIAAQLATFSLGLLYFHQFPVYFLLSNLFVIPGAFSILIMGVVLLLISYLTPVAAFVGGVLETIIKLMNNGIFIVEGLPGSRLDNVYITPLQCLLLGATLICFLLMMNYRKFKYFTGGAILIILFSCSQWLHAYENFVQEKITVYKISGHYAYDIISSGKAYFFADLSLSKTMNSGKAKFHIDPNRLASGVGKIHPGNDQGFRKTFRGCSVMKWNNTNILQIEGTDFSFPEPLEIDLLMISNNALDDLKSIKEMNCKQVIIDCSNSFFLADKLFQEALANKIPVHSLWHQGAFEILI